ncbi:hypothetical protein CHT98_07935 (plasmid) [Azospirillum brasilense]|uniref:Uncharacterized protein n=1 Tax=Azospirillum brasilense TaxID=192 RepID=A0A235HG86_AZOBR|nr:hypothetical protein CHT98_07935 [Azospirillum brasilense]
MWTEATRGRMARIEKKTKRYSTDLSDKECFLMEPLRPPEICGPWANLERVAPLGKDRLWFDQIHPVTCFDASNGKKLL